MITIVRDRGYRFGGRRASPSLAQRGNPMRCREIVIRSLDDFAGGDRRMNNAGAVQRDMIHEADIGHPTAATLVHAAE